MNVSAFLRKHHGADASLSRTVTNALAELGDRLDTDPRQPPTHLPDQRDLIRDLFDTDQPVWLVFFDAGRYDMFDQLVWDYFDGHLRRAWNGGVSYTGDWAMRNLRGDFGDRGLFSWLPLRSLQAVDYDGRDHFAAAPDLMAAADQQERLAALGYAESSTERTFEISPQHVNEAVRARADEMNGGVVRYLKPHPPFAGLEDLTSESSKTLNTRQALDSGALSYEELTAAYRRTYLTAFEHARALVPRLDGRVILTADHGTCLTCGQLFHGRRLKNHDHMTIVPWFEVDAPL